MHEGDLYCLTEPLQIIAVVYVRPDKDRQDPAAIRRMLNSQPLGGAKRCDPGEDLVTQGLSLERRHPVAERLSQALYLRQHRIADREVLPVLADRRLPMAVIGNVFLQDLMALQE